jgi:hypothetical protein
VQPLWFLLSRGWGGYFYVEVDEDLLSRRISEVKSELASLEGSAGYLEQKISWLRGTLKQLEHDLENSILDVKLFRGHPTTFASNSRSSATQ